MEFEIALNLLDTTSDDKDSMENRSKFMIKKKKKCSIYKGIKIKTSMFRSDLRDLIALSIKHNSIV